MSLPLPGRRSANVGVVTNAPFLSIAAISTDHGATVARNVNVGPTPRTEIASVAEVDEYER
jgi:hypothetical protein